MQPKIANKSLKHLFLEFKVIQDHWCWHSSEAHRNCLLWQAACLCLSGTIFTLDKPIAKNNHFFRGLPFFDTRVGRPPWA